MNNAEAREILGVRSDASISDIEKRYFVLLKKRRAEEAQGEDVSREEFEKMTQAYNFLMGYEEPSSGEQKAPNPVLKKMGIDEKKAGNFFYYYKFHIIIGVIILIAAFFTVKSFVTQVKPDFNTAFIGNIYYTDTDKLYASVKESVPEIKEPGFDGAYITPSGDSQNDYAMTMKAMAVTAAGGVDLYIMDKANFQKYAQAGLFVSLDDIAPKLGADLSKNKDYVLKTDEDPTEHLYGIDISDSKVLADSGIQAEEMIAGIAANSKKQDTAVKLIQYLMKMK